MAGSARLAKSAHEVKTLLASAAQTATSTGETAVRLPVADAYAFILDLTNAATDVDDTLDVFIQTRVDDGGGANWLDVVHFTQILGNGSNTLQFVSKISRSLATVEYEVGSALGAAAVRNILGDEYRVRFAIVDPGDADQTFTFSVTAMPM